MKIANWDDTHCKYFERRTIDPSTTLAKCEQICDKDKEIWGGPVLLCEKIPTDMEDFNGRSEQAAKDGMKYILGAH